ncbi:whirlin-like isoform X2 [Acanthaster planci]|uniref:Whirlin-like isoform X2 n=1 Tax=Acanthaster planci TaxID=133434 RepID=A0A8B7ZL31_ACAPL|nr:whirlin-like isoform X2 [Acanthaster planci]
MSSQRSAFGEPPNYHRRPRSRSATACITTTSGASRTMSANVRRLHEALNSTLPDHDRAYFVHALNEYNSRRNVYTLVANLKAILDSPEKRQLYLLLEKVLPSSDQALFWQHAEPLYNERRQLESVTNNRKTNVSRGEQKHHFDTMPTRTRPLDMYDEPHGKTHRKTSGRSWETDANKDVRRIVFKKSDSQDGELGFSIRGGSEHSVGIFVSLVEPNTMAERKGLQPGDQLIQVNDIPLEKITHGEAVKVLRTAKKLVLYVKSVGRVPGSFVCHQTYTWVDPQGRSVSPPPDVDLMGQRMSESLGRKSGLNLLKDGDEKKVNLLVDDGQSLGLMIRGGHEFSLGIYITGVDAYSVAEHAGLKVGDQILDVNGENFLDINHQEAVNILKSSKLMMMTIKDVGKLPYARTTIDRTQWITGDGVSDLPRQVSRLSSVVNGGGTELVQNSINGNVNGEKFNRSVSSSNFSRGIAGTQVMYNSSLGSGSQAWGMIEDQARHLLNENEQGTMMYYLKEYQNATICVDALVMALFELLNTHAKFSLFSEIRSFVFPRDIDHFDSLVLKREVESMKARQRGHFMNERESLFGDTFSSGSYYSSSSIDSRPITPPQVPAQLPPFVKMTSDPDDWSSGFDLKQINEDTNGLPDFSMPDLTFGSTPPLLMRPSSSGHMSSKITPSKSTLQSNHKTITVDVHHHEEPSSSQGGKTSSEGIYSGSVKSPSEDSGVDLQLNGSTISRRNGDRVTISPIPPVTIHSPGSLSDIESPITSVGSPQSASSPEPPVVRQDRPRRSLSRRLSLDSQSTEGSSVAALAEVPRKLSCSNSEHSIPRRISDPTHHVPREQKRNIEQNKKASETLLALKKQPRIKATLTKPANAPPPPPSQFAPSPSSRSSTPPPPPPIPAPPPPKGDQTNQRSAVRPPPPPPPRQGSMITTRSAHEHTLQDHPSTSQTLESSKRTSHSNGHSNANGMIEHVPDEPLDMTKRSQCPIVNVNDEFPEGIELISVRKTKPNLGIAVEGGAGTRQPLPKVIKVQYGGSAYHNSNLKVGHVILKVNGRSLHGLTHQQATRCIAEAFKNKTNDGINFLVIDSNRYFVQY